jgi:hypothetical protein
LTSMVVGVLDMSSYKHTRSLQWAAYQTDTLHDLADLLKLPEDWVRFRWTSAPRWERDMVRTQDPVYGRISVD